MQQSIRYCLDSASLRDEDVDLYVSTDTNLFRPNAARQFDRINHHLAHAASSYFPSGFEAAAILVIDGNGSLVTHDGVTGHEAATIASGDGSSIEIVDRVLEHSIGHFYEAVTMGLGFGPLEEGKTMGLAPFGEPSKIGGELASAVSFDKLGRMEFRWDTARVRKFVRDAVASADAADVFQRRANIAYAAQHLIEQGVLRLAELACELTGSRNLCLAGGVALNSVANGRLVTQLGLDSVFVQPAPGDNGLALGAALYGWHKANPRAASRPQKSAGLGRPYSDEEVRAAFRDLPEGILVRHRAGPAPIAALLSLGHIGGWFQGRSEFGPRALGFRSILADPRRPDMKDVLNARVKHREPFRPFAPAVLAERRADYFEAPFDSPFMQFTWPVQVAMKAAIPAVVHVDGTARLQTVSRENNPAFYELLQEFEQLTSVPVLLNTSFNDNNEPIVETPADGVRAFLRTELDFLAIGDYLLTKPGIGAGVLDS